METQAGSCSRWQPKREGLVILENHAKFSHASRQAKHIWLGDDFKFERLTRFIDKVQVVDEWGSAQVGFQSGLQAGQPLGRFTVFLSDSWH
jgi:hypothetical protein